MSMHPVMRCLSNVAVFDPDIVYAYTTPLIEVDHLCVYTEGSDPGILRYLDVNIPKGRYVVLEEVSQSQEVVVKRAKRALLSISYPPTTLWFRKCLSTCGVIKSVKIDPWLYLVISELLNASLYTILLLPEEMAMDAVVSLYEVVNYLDLLRTTETSNSLTKLIHLVESLSSKQFVLEPYIETKLKKLKSVCNSKAWVALLQWGIGRYRLKRIRESIDFLKELCKHLGCRADDLRTVYVISERVKRSLEAEGIKLDEVANILNAQKQVEVMSCDNVELREVGTFVHLLSESIDYGDYVKNILKQVDTITVMIFGDFSKILLKQMIDKNMDAIENGKFKFMVIDEAFYTPTAGVDYGVTTLFGYLFGIKSFINEMKRDERLRELITQPQIRALLVILKSLIGYANIYDPELYGILLLILKTLII